MGMKKIEVIKYSLVFIAIVIIFVVGGYFAYNFGRMLKNTDIVVNATRNTTTVSAAIYNTTVTTTV